MRALEIDLAFLYVVCYSKLRAQIEHGKILRKQLETVRIHKNGNVHTITMSLQSLHIYSINCLIQFPCSKFWCTFTGGSNQVQKKVKKLNPPSTSLLFELYLHLNRHGFDSTCLHI